MPPQRLARGLLVGRQADLAALRAAIGVPNDGSSSPASVLLAGDAGVGKTRLTSEVAAAAEEAGWMVLAGHCLDLGDAAVPYLPFREMFSRLADEHPDLARAVAGRCPAIAVLVPSLAPPADRPPPQRAGHLDRPAVLEAVADTLGWLAASRRLLVVVEDLHWSDASTRDMVGYLLARQPEQVALLGTYRSDDLHRRHPLRAALAEWSRFPRVIRLTVPPLPDNDMRELVRILVDSPIPEPVLQGIVSRAGGNPFFAEELAAASDAGARLPPILADVLLVRIDSLAEQTRSVVRAAAVAGREVGHDVLAAVLDIPETALQSALREAVEEHVLVAGPGSYAFRHALLAEAVYDDLLPGERVRLHRAYAEALGGEGRQADVDASAAELARHARASGDLETAITASVAAGDEAMSIAGWQEATRHFEVALELVAQQDPALAWDADGAAGSVRAPRVDVVAVTEKVCLAASAAGDVLRAVSLVQDQLHLLPSQAPPEARARLLLALGTAATVADTPVDVLKVSREALDLLPAERTALRARVMLLHARACLEWGREEAAARWAQDALDSADRLGMEDVAAEARLIQAQLRERAGDPDASMRTVDEVLASARRSGDRPAELATLYLLGALRHDRGQWAEAAEAYRSALDIATDLHRQWSPYGVFAHFMSAVTAYGLGDWDEALRLTDTSSVPAPELGWALLNATRLAVAAGRGEQTALELVPLLRHQWTTDGSIAVWTAIGGIDLHGQRGDLSAATALHDDVVDAVGSMWNVHFQGRVRLAALLVGQLANTASRPGTRERAALVGTATRYVEGLADVDHQMASLGRTPGQETVAWSARVTAEFAQLRWLAGIDPPVEEELAAAWQRSIDGFQRLGCRFETARSQARLAAVYKAIGDSTAAATLVGEAESVARDLGAEPLLTELSTVIRGRARPARRTTYHDLLTDREREVLQLVAAGRSNREIGARLFISTKTASVHVSHILAKLGATGRTEAVAIARDRGLLAS